MGAGNGDSVPQRRLAARAGRIDLIDLDAAAAGRARERAGGAARVLPGDVPGGAADRIVQAAWRGRDALDPAGPRRPDRRSRPTTWSSRTSFLSQVLYPALLDRGLEQRRDRRGAAPLRRPAHGLDRRPPDWAAPGGVVVHAHDPAGWWDGHPQPVRARGDPRRAGRRRCARARSSAARGRPAATHASPRRPRGPRSAPRRSGAGRSRTASTTWSARRSPGVF